MNVYDFDGTIYRGDSTIDFYLFCLKKYPCIIKRFPKQMKAVFNYKMHKIKKIQMKEIFFSFLKDIHVTDDFLHLFWLENAKKIEKWYLERQKKDDLIISASPVFLLQPICRELNVHLIATEVNVVTGEFMSENCYGKEKVFRFKEHYPTENIESFFSDSYSDRPLKELADKAYLVKRGRLDIWK